MIPLSLAEKETELIIKKVGGNPEIKKRLENLGFTAGGIVIVVNRLGENVIVKVKDSRIAIDNTMAEKIMV
ncbi:MAG: ferrous iron transport protein A [Clostridia bacterium]|nr:ferrous iron transport protein A [Clostridia bacterium]